MVGREGGREKVRGSGLSIFFDEKRITSIFFPFLPPPSHPSPFFAGSREAVRGPYLAFVTSSTEVSTVLHTMYSSNLQYN